MTKVVVVRRQGSIVSVECSGHSGYADEGADIVCAGLSSIVQTAALGLMKTAGADNIAYSVDSDRGYLKIVVRDISDTDKRHDCDVILDTMLLGVEDYAEGLPKFVSLEVKEDVY